jgi:hypothetical protein
VGLRRDAEQLAQVKSLLLVAVLSACGARTDLSAPAADDALDDSGADPESGSAASDPDAPEPGVTDPKPGATTPEPGAMNPAPGSRDPEPDPVLANPNCTPNNAKGGMACSQPCVTTCGFYDLGTKACDCVSGVFVSCHCPRPWNYQGHTTAPACATPDGRTHWLDNTPCADEWTQCIGSDPVSGTNPRGCVCLTDPVSGQLEWTCGSTNKWFLSE